MCHVSNMLYYSILLIAVLSYVRSNEYDPMILPYYEGKLQFISPAFLIDGEYLFDFYVPTANSHLFTFCTNSEGLLKANEIQMGYVNMSEHKCTGNAIKTSTRRLEAGVYGIGYELYGLPKERIRKAQIKSSDNAPSHTQNQSEGGQHKPLQENSPAVTVDENPDGSEFFEVLTVTFDAETMSTSSIAYKHFFANDIFLSENTNVDKIPFNTDTEAYQQLNDGLNALYAEAKEQANSKPYPVKRQLLPDRDCLLDAWKALTYHDLNTAPMYNIFVDKWESIEDTIRKILFRFHKPSMVVGTALIDENEPKYIKDKLVRIPDLFYKVFANFFKEEVHGMIIVMHNRADLKGESICEDVCKKYHWDGISTEDSKTERAYCCDFNRENLKKLKVTLTDDLPEETRFETLDLMKTKVEVNYLQSSLFIRIDFIELLKNYHSSNVIRNGEIVEAEFF